MTEDRLIGWRKDMKTGRGGRSRATVVMDSAMHTYVMVCLSQRRLSQTAAARICGCSVQFLNAVIMGRKRSQEIQHRFATLVMGARSWDDLEWRALAFQEHVAASAGRSGDDADVV